MSSTSLEKEEILDEEMIEPVKDIEEAQDLFELTQHLIESLATQQKSEAKYLLKGTVKSLEKVKNDAQTKILQTEKNLLSKLSKAMTEKQEKLKTSALKFHLTYLQVALVVFVGIMIGYFLFGKKSHISTSISLSTL
jgi:hypothetical protein